MKQVEEKIIIESFNSMSRNVPSSRYWKVFNQWKTSFKSLNKKLLSTLKSDERNGVYKEYYGRYYVTHFTATR